MQKQRRSIVVIALLGCAALLMFANRRSSDATRTVVDDTGQSKSKESQSRSFREHLSPVARDRMMKRIEAARAHRLAQTEAEIERKSPHTSEPPRRDQGLRENENDSRTLEAVELPGSSRSYIRRQISEIRPLLEECVAKNSPPDVEGMLQVSFTIDGEPGVGGLVRDSKIVTGTFPTSPELAQCFEETLTSIKVDPPEAGGSINVNYPFSIRRSGGIDGPGLRDYESTPTPTGQIPGFAPQDRLADVAGARG